MKYKMQKAYWISIVLFILGGAGIGYLWYQNDLLKKYGLNLENELSITKADFASTTANLNSIIDSLSLELSQTKAERSDFEQKYIDEKGRMDIFASQISGVQGTVGYLEKLSQTDPELLQKYSKIYFLNENYTPETLVKISSGYTYDSKEDYFFYSKAWPFLQDLLTSAAGANIDIKIISAFRSFSTQSELKSTYKIIYGSGANQFSADQGYSEHQLGTTVDFTTSGVGASYSGFDKTLTYQWLLDNAYKYGFIVSYPKDNGYYQFEPWHWRFVGRDLASKLRQQGKNFYDLDQREIDQSLAFFFD